MTIETLSEFFMWCSIINLGGAFTVFIIFFLAKGFVYKIHSQLFGISEEKVAELVYSALINYKTIIFVFNVIPWLAIQLIK